MSYFTYHLISDKREVLYTSNIFLPKFTTSDVSDTPDQSISSSIPFVEQNHVFIDKQSSHNSHFSSPRTSDTSDSADVVDISMPVDSPQEQRLLPNICQIIIALVVIILLTDAIWFLLIFMHQFIRIFYPRLQPSKNQIITKKPVSTFCGLKLCEKS